MTFRGFGFGIMRRLRGGKIDEADLVIRECRRLGRGSVFYDVGANIGTVSDAMVGLASRIVAMEPDPASFASLSRRMAGKAVCINALIGPDGAERLFLHNEIASASSTSVAPDEAHVGGEYSKVATLSAVSLDTIAQIHGQPDLVKIDVEGFELSVLDSAKAVLAGRPIIVMEFNAFCLSNFGRVNPRDAIDRLLAQFPKVEVITPEGRQRVTDPYSFLHANIVTHGSVDNLVCSWD